MERVARGKNGVGDVEMVEARDGVVARRDEAKVYPIRALLRLYDVGSSDLID